MSGSDESSPAGGPLPPPLLLGERVEQERSSTTLEQLLELASQAQAARFAGGTLVGECLDTHNPHLPRRVLVRARDEEGKLVSAWLPVLTNLRIGIGAKLLLSKPDNWSEPIVIGVIAGLERPEEQPSISTEGPTLRLEPGQALSITDASGQPFLALEETATGPRVALLQRNVEITTPGNLRISAERIELSAREGGVDVRAEGEAVVRGRVIRLN